MVKRELRARIPRGSRNENLLWTELGGREKLYVAVVYLVPKDSDGRNSMTLRELQEDLVHWRSKGKVVVGDFNARVGELSNHIHIPDADINKEGQIFSRTSQDKIVDG